MAPYVVRKGSYFPVHSKHSVHRVRYALCGRSFTHVHSRHGTGKVRYDVIKSFDLVVKQIESFRGVYMSFEHYVLTAQNEVDVYLILPKVYLESDQFGNPAPLDRSIPVVSSRFWTF